MDVYWHIIGFRIWCEAVSGDVEGHVEKVLKLASIVIFNLLSLKILQMLFFYSLYLLWCCIECALTVVPVEANVVAVFFFYYGQDIKNIALRNCGRSFM